MLTRAARLAGAAAVGLLVSAAHGSPVNIDTFDLGSLNGYIFGTTSASFSETIADPNQTLRGRRGVDIDASAASGDGTANFMVTGGRLAMGTNTAIPPYAARWLMGYGSYPYRVDLIDDDGAPNTGLLLEFVSAEYDYDLNVRLHMVVPIGGHPGYSATISRTLPANLNPHQVFLPFSQFTVDPNFGFEWVQFIGVTIVGAPDGDYKLDRISANVPEPSCAVLLALGLVALKLRRRPLKH